MNKGLIAERIREIAETAANDVGLELVHVEMIGTQRNPSVRIFIDKAEGVTLDDCSNVSRRIEAVLDAEDFIPTAYNLEVSSPGLERELYSLKDFEKFAGHLAKVKTANPVNGQKNFSGRIIEIKGEEIVFEDKTKGIIQFPYNAVAKANLEIDLEEELKRNS
ncbi:MAG: ribosome maturation factor RimP [Pyrinomonadaceae bacterium]